jgi:peptide deformylase
LKARAEEVSEITDEIRAVWDEMLDAMYAMPGVGLAAPQLGIGLRLAVLDCSETKDQPIRLANPLILKASDGTQPFTEASPNLPGVSAEILRPEEVTVTYLDETGASQERMFDGLWAVSVQHQIDHLDGKLFVDRLSPMKRQRLLSAWRKEQKSKARRRS